MANFGTARIFSVITLLILLAVTPIVVDAIAGVNTTGWDFEGYAGAITLLNLVPFIWIASLLLGIIVSVLT